MNWQRLKLWLANIFGFFEGNPIAVYAVGLLILFIFIGGTISYCNNWRTDKKLQHIETNINKAEVNDAVLEVEANKVNANVKESQINSNIAYNAFNNSVRRDSNTFPGNEATDRFCAKFPNDSSCSEWRRAHNMQSTTR